MAKSKAMRRSPMCMSHWCEWGLGRQKDNGGLQGLVVVATCPKWMRKRRTESIFDETARDDAKSRGDRDGRGEKELRRMCEGNSDRIMPGVMLVSAVNRPMVSLKG